MAIIRPSGGRSIIVPVGIPVISIDGLGAVEVSRHSGTYYVYREETPLAGGWTEPRWMAQAKIICPHAGAAAAREIMATALAAAGFDEHTLLALYGRLN